MKKILIICFLAVVCGRLCAQSLPQFSQYRLQKGNDFKLADSAVLQSANYLLSTPIDQNKETRVAAAQFLMKWMDGTPDYTFTLDENSTKYFLQNTDLMIVYMASLTKYAMQNKPHNSRTITINAIKMLLAYINNPANDVKKDDGLKQLSEANDKGELERFLNL